MEKTIKCLCGYEAEEQRWSELNVNSDIGLHLYIEEDERRYPCIIRGKILVCPKCGTMKAMTK